MTEAITEEEAKTHALKLCPNVKIRKNKENCLVYSYEVHTGRPKVISWESKIKIKNENLPKNIWRRFFKWLKKHRGALEAIEKK